MMSNSIEDLESQALKLSFAERAQLAKKLLLSLDAPSDAENLALWVAEAEFRLRELRAGKAREIPMEEAFRTAREAIS